MVKKVNSQGVEGYRASDPKEKPRFVIEEAEEDLEGIQKASPFLVQVAKVRGRAADH